MLKIFLNAFMFLSFSTRGRSVPLPEMDATDLEKTDDLNMVRDIDFSRNFSDTYFANPYWGDIRMTDEELELLEMNITVYQNALADPEMRWPRKTVPYYIDKIYNRKHRDVMLDAMNFLERETCIKFVPIDPELYDGHYIHLLEKHPRECSAFVGHVPEKESPQQVRLGRQGCLYDLGTVEHELLHVLGLDHEHNRPDRDSYVNVFGENVDEELRDNFNIMSNVITYDQPYDYGSVMQYANDAFGKTESGRRKVTMLAKKNPKICLGQRRGATQCDLEKVRLMYGCRMKDNCKPREQYPLNGHYTQVVWRKSTQLGIGIAKKSSKNGTTYVVVCNYYPPGNFKNEYTKNVFPEKKYI